MTHATDAAPALVIVGRFMDPGDALVARSALRAYGVPADLADEGYCQMDWWIALGVGGVRVVAPASYAADAAALLAPQTDHAWERRAVESVSQSFQRQIVRLAFFVAAMMLMIALFIYMASPRGAGAPEMLAAIVVSAGYWPAFLAPIWARGRLWSGEA